MNELQIFNYNDTPLRTVEREDGIWFIAADVCKNLGLDSVHTAMSRIESDEGTLVEIPHPQNAEKTLQVNAVNEPGLYALILGSRKPEAKDFKRWVTHEVLPSIRQHGSYALAPTQPMTPAQLLAAQAQLLVDMERRMDEMQGQTRALEAKVDTAMKAFSRPAEDHWRSDMDNAVKDLNKAMGWSLPKLRGKLFSELEHTVNCNLDARLRCLRNRKKKTGMRYRDAALLGKLDAIAADKQLRAIFEGIVRSYQAQAVPTGEAAE